MGVPVEFEKALRVSGKLGEVEIQDVQVEAAVAVKCLCGGDRVVFIARMTKPGFCPSCERPYFVKQVHVVPDGESDAYSVTVAIRPGLTAEEAARSARPQH